ncbi:MAG TPA: hypothetical protein VKZ81_22000, partial [Pseudonocardia sp.]|nr:hypothetical protein [Pseudonocardia sp.]
VVGLDDLQAQYTAQYGPGGYIPNVFVQYWSMRTMAYLDSLVPLVALWGLWRRRRLARRRGSCARRSGCCPCRSW